MPIASLSGAARPGLVTVAPLPALSRTAVLLPVLLLAAALRLPYLDAAPFWYDETATDLFARLPWDKLLHGFAWQDTNPPWFYALEKIAGGVAGFSDLGLRLLPALFGLAGVLMVTLVTEAAFGRRAAVWAGLVIATQAQHLEHSREARVYTALFACLGVALWAGHRVVRHGRVRDAAVLAAAAGAAAVLHATGPLDGACVFLACGTMLLLGPGSRGGRLLLLAVAAAAALVAAAPTIIGMQAVALTNANDLGWIPVPGPVLATQYMLSVLGAPVLGWYRLPDWLLPLGVGGALMFVAGVLGWGAARAVRDPCAAGLMVGLVAAVGLYCGLSQIRPFMLERTLLFTLLFFVPLCGALLAAVPAPVRVVLAAVILLLQGPGVAAVFVPVRQDEDWRALAAAVSAEAVRTAAPVVVLGGFETLALQRYQAEGAPGQPRVTLLTEGRPSMAERLVRQYGSAAVLPQDAAPDAFCAALGGSRTALLVLRERPGLEADGAAASGLPTAAGGTPAGAWQSGRLVMRRWQGLCR